jgi:phosphate starvation-inducible PhoH-like protein
LSRPKKRERRYQNANIHTAEEPTLIDIKNYIKKKNEVTIIPRNTIQETYLELLKNPKKYIVFAIGPAGTGKTMIGVQMAIKHLKERKVDKIVITRPAVSVDEDLGFLPGKLEEKMEPWTRPIFDVFREYYHAREITAMLENGVIEISPLGMMRGRTFKSSFIVADEMQNATPSQMKMLLTRIGDDSRMVVTGDLRQADRPSNNGLLEFVRLLNEYSKHKMIDIVKFDMTNVERHPVVKEVLSIYKEEE